MATILYRRIDTSNGQYEPVWGVDQAAFNSDLQAVAQLILTRLKLNTGEWFENLLDGLPLWQQILGQGHGKNQAFLNLLIQQRIRKTYGVVGVSNVQSSYNSSTRSYSFSCTVKTQFGSLSLSNATPAPPSQGV